MLASQRAARIRLQKQERTSTAGNLCIGTVLLLLVLAVGALEKSDILLGIY